MLKLQLHFGEGNIKVLELRLAARFNGLQSLTLWSHKMVMDLPDLDIAARGTKNA